MKKLLLSLTAFSLVGSSMATVSCVYTNKARDEFAKSIQKIINVANVSAEAQILASENGSNVVDYKDSSKKVNNTEYSTSKANMDYKYLIKTFSNMKASEFLPQSDWVKLLSGDKEWDDSVYIDRHLVKNYGIDWNNDQFALTNNDINNLNGKKTGSSSTTSTLSLVSSLIGVLFGSDFNVGEAQFLNTLLPTILNMIDSSAKESLASTLQQILPKLNNLPKLDDVKKVFYNPLKSKMEKEEDVYTTFSSISENFWKSILGKNSEESTFVKISSILQFVFTLMWYIQKFDGYKEITPEVLSKVNALKITNEDVTNYDEIDITKLSRMIKGFLKPDPKNISAKNLVVILFGIPAKSAQHQPKSNILFESLFKVLNPQTENAKSESRGIIPDGIIWTNAIKMVIEWVSGNNGIPSNVVKEIIRVLNILIDIINNKKFNLYEIIQIVLNEAIFRPLTENNNSLLIIGDILYVVATMINSKSDKQVIDMEGIELISSVSGVKADVFNALYGRGLLKSIFQLVNVFKPGTIGDVVVNNFTDLQGIFETKFDVIFNDMLNIKYENNLQFLYGLRNSTLSSLLVTIGEKFEPGVSGRNYFFDLGAIRNLILSLFDTQDISIDGKGENIVQGEEIGMTNLKAIFATLEAGLTNKKVIIDGQEVASETAVINALGLSPNKKTIKKGTVFDAVSQAYGHRVPTGNGDETEERPEKRENTIKIVSTLLEGISWMSKTSEKSYVDDNFGHFLSQKNWSTSFITETNFGDIHQDAEIKYFLTYSFRKYKVQEIYEITLKREKTPSHIQFGNSSFKVKEIKRK